MYFQIIFPQLIILPSLGLNLTKKRNERPHVVREVFPFPHESRPRGPKCLRGTWSSPFEKEISAPETDNDKANFEAKAR